MRFLVGTSGYAYKEWVGPFYPEKTKADAMLGLYSAKFPTVEINNTFYRMPRENVIEQWADRVSSGFAFSIKAPRRITHFAKLKDVGDSVAFLFKAVSLLGEKRGPVLFQLPPHLRKDGQVLRAFVETVREIDAEQRVVMEFRHASWFDDEIHDVLRDGKIALCLAVGDATKPLPDLTPTTDWGYVRFREDRYRRDDLRRWRDHLGALAWKEAYVYFKHDDAGPLAAIDFIEITEGSA